MNERLAAFFVAGPGTGGLFLLASCTPTELCCRARVVAENAAQAGADPAVLIRIAPRGFARLLQWLLLPIACLRAECIVERRAHRRAARFAIAPDADAPTWVYQIGGAASAYTHAHLMRAGDRLRWLRRAFRWWTGCDPAVAALLVVGLRR